MDAPSVDAAADAGAPIDAPIDAPPGLEDAFVEEDAPAPDDAGPADDAFSPIDAFTSDDAFAPPDAFSPTDAFSPIDAFARDAFVVPDAFSPDAFSARDAFVVPDAFVAPDAYSPPDAFVAPDAYSPPSCSGVADCGRCGAGYCVAGTCAMSNPTSLVYDFEAGVPTGWTNGMGGTAAWTIDTTTPHGGARALRSGVIGHSAQSRVGFSITLLNEASLSFWVRTSTESCCDEGELYVDGVVRATRAGTTAWTQYDTSLSPGTHSIEFRYTKDGSIASGSDAVWIDDVVIGPPSDPSTGFETTGLPGGYVSSGTALWTTVTTMPHGGSRCAESGNISDSETSSMTRTVTLASAQTLTFWIRTSTEASYDYLRTYVDGTMRDQWSGTTGWTMVSYALTAGTHTIEWRYEKDGSLSSGSDAVWVDDVSFGPPPTGGPLCGP